ncbi:hypothetical protein CROQUDRAFT_456122 [Cronartium quercuum f. sp. fusiforme G11]|uniref:DASH complex subunit DUO1 n=1 Tax=Cronartium quercuum f. sp. fusiforme G11 TaxID=708437 RepID=A0A9P6NP79_9BASI|nr:hypothetical protein CROQUDRAFT_456122 [Cronartium quercuum f. sp. fusiforme G11]
MSRKQVSPLKDGSGSCDMAIEDDFLNNSISMHLSDDSFIGDQAVGSPQASSSNGSSGPFADTHVQPINRSHISSPSKGTVKPNTSSVETHDNAVSRTDRQPGDKWLQEIRRNGELQKERDWLRSINDILEKAADDLDSLPEKIQRVQQASETSHRLLDLYSSILTQTEHTRELLSDPTWEGLTEV